MEWRDQVEEEGPTPAAGGLVGALLGRLAAHRSRHAVTCLVCDTVRIVVADAGECPACGYLGWRLPGDPRRGRPAPALDD